MCNNTHLQFQHAQVPLILNNGINLASYNNTTDRMCELTVCRLRQVCFVPVPICIDVSPTQYDILFGLSCCSLLTPASIMFVSPVKMGIAQTFTEAFNNYYTHVFGLHTQTQKKTQMYKQLQTPYRLSRIQRTLQDYQQRRGSCCWRKS